MHCQKQMWLFILLKNVILHGIRFLFFNNTIPFPVS